MRKSAAAARSSSPIVVRLSSSVRPAEQHGGERSTATIVTQRIRSVPSAIASLSVPSVPTVLAARAEGEQVDVLEQVADGEGRDEHRHGRGAPQRAEGDALLHERDGDADGDAGGDRDGAGQPLRKASV